MLLKKHYIILLLSTLLFGNVTAKEHGKSEIKSFVKGTPVSNIVIISGENITLNNNAVYNVLKNGSSAKIKKTNGRLKLQAGKKIVFKPGTKIKAGKGKSFHALVVNVEQQNKPDELITARYKFFKEADNNKNEVGGLSKGSGSGSIGLGSWNISAVVVENQQRKVGGSTILINHCFQKAATAIDKNNKTEGYSFNPETIKVLRL